MFKKEDLQNIQLEHGIAFLNYGEADARRLGPTRGGATFNATQTIRDIEFDGQMGKSKGMQVIDAIDCNLAVVALPIGIDDLLIAMPYLKKTGTDPNFKLECSKDSLGLIPDSAYLKNVTFFGKVAGGGYKKITIYNAMNEAPFSLAAVPKGEGTVSLEFHGHWETDDVATVENLFVVEDVASITAA